MGWHSTINVTSEASRSYALRKIEVMSDDDLRDLMDFLLYKIGYNVSFVAETEENENNLLEID